MKSIKNNIVLLILGCFAIFTSSCGGSEEKTIKNERLHPFLLSGVYTVNGFGGPEEFFKLFSDNINTKPGDRGFLHDLNEGYDILFVFPKGDKSASRREFAKSWDINNKEDFLKTAEELLTDGHQKAYEFCRKVLDENGGEQADISKIDLKKYKSGGSRFENTKNLKFVKENYGKFSKSGIKAWDIARYVNNINLAHASGYITDEEGLQMSVKALAEAQKYYDNWNDYWSDFNLGRLFWGGDDSDVFAKLTEALLNKENAYNIYNYMPLK